MDHAKLCGIAKMDGAMVTRRAWTSITLSALLGLMPLAAPRAQDLDCTAMRAEIDALRRPIEAGRAEAALRRQQQDLQRDRDAMEDLGCTGDSGFEADRPQCRALAGRVERLESGLESLESQASGAFSDEADVEKRRLLTAQYDARCARASDEPASPPDAAGSVLLPGPDDAPTTIPVDPDRPPEVAPSKLSRVICVRQCDGAFYPLAVDVAPEKVAGLDQLCKAQCPNAQAGAYTLGADDDLGQAVAVDGSSYQALPSAFAYQKASVPACSCRAPHASWAETLADAETMLEPQKGDVTVTPALAASMARPVVTPPAAAAVQPAATTPAPKPSKGKKSAHKKPPPATAVDADAPDAGLTNPGVDITRQFRRAAPTL